MRLFSANHAVKIAYAVNVIRIHRTKYGEWLCTSIKLPDWPHFTWRQNPLTALLAEVRQKQGKLMGRIEGLGFKLQEEPSRQTLTLDLLKSSEIEGNCWMSNR